MCPEIIFPNSVPGAGIIPESMCQAETLDQFLIALDEYAKTA